MPKTGSQERSGKWWRGIGSEVRGEYAVDNCVGQNFQPGIQDGMSGNVHRKRETTASNQVSNDMTFKERNIGTQINRNGRPGIGERKL